MDLALEPRLFGQLRHSQILHDERIGPDELPHQLQLPACRHQLVGLEQGVKGQIELAVPVTRQLGQRRQFVKGEVLRRHAGAE